MRMLACTRGHTHWTQPIHGQMRMVARLREDRHERGDGWPLALPSSVLEGKLGQKWTWSFLSEGEEG